MKHITTLIALLLFVTQQVTAQNYTIDWAYERSGNARIKQNDKAGLIDSNKKIIIPALYDEVTDFYNGFARVVKNGKVGFVNKESKEVIPCLYEVDTLWITGVEILTVILPDTDIRRMEIGPKESRMVGAEDLFCVTKNGKYGFVDAANKTIIPFQFEGADNFFDSIAIVIVNDKYGAIDHKGKIVIPCEYQRLIWDFSTGSYPYSIYAEKNGKHFRINKKGQQVNEWDLH